MVKLNPEICRKIKDARRSLKLSQSAVADEVGCRQSALSMFEQGDGTKLNEEVIGRLAKKFGVSLTGEREETGKNVIDRPIPPEYAASAEIRNRGFCPNAHCPTNKAYEVDGRTLYLPDRETADPVGGRFCAMCGEVLEKRCPNCGAPVHDGAVCTFCGDSFVATP